MDNIETKRLSENFLSFLRKLRVENGGKFAPAWRSLIEDYLRRGRIIPGYETDWQGIYHQEHLKWAIPGICPYSRKCKKFPHGWSYRNLARLVILHMR